MGRGNGGRRGPTSPPAASGARVRRPLFDPALLGWGVEIDERELRTMDETALEEDLARLEEVWSELNQRAQQRQEAVDRARQRFYDHVKALRREIDDRQAKRADVSDAVSIADVLDDLGIPGSLRIDRLPLCDRKTGRALEAFVYVSPESAPDRYISSIPEKTVADLRAVNHPRRVDVYARFASTGQRLRQPDGRELERVVIPRARLARVVAEHLRAAGLAP